MDPGKIRGVSPETAGGSKLLATADRAEAFFRPGVFEKVSVRDEICMQTCTTVVTFLFKANAADSSFSARFGTPRLEEGKKRG